MKEKLAVLAIAAVLVAATATSASALDFTGYFRSGVGFDSKGGGQACFSLPGTEYKSRLGNECDNYLELSFAQTIYKSDDGVEFRYEFMPAFGLSTNSTETGWENDPAKITGWGYGTGNLYVQQNWGSVKLPQLGGASIWAGWRYFYRHSIHALDWFWWNPMQRQGAVGIENVNLGFGKLAFTLARMEVSPAAGAIATFGVPDLRISDIKLWENGSLEVGVDLAIYGGGGNVPTTSPWFTVVLNQAKLAGGDNTLAFQYASGAIYKMRSEGGVDTPPTGVGPKVGSSESKQWRILDEFVYHPIPEFSGALALVYQDEDADKDNGITLFTAQIRPAYHLNEYFKIAADIAYQTAALKHQPSGTKIPYLLKATLAPTIVAGQKGGYGARPEIRFFVTYGAWGNLYPLSKPVAGGVFGTANNGLSWGAQMEAWW